VLAALVAALVILALGAPSAQAHGSHHHRHARRHPVSRHKLGPPYPASSPATPAPAAPVASAPAIDAGGTAEPGPVEEPMPITVEEAAQLRDAEERDAHMTQAEDEALAAELEAAPVET
jgi:hypothetical protein